VIHVGLDLHHRNSYVRAVTDKDEWIPGRRVYHDEIETLWQYLGQFGDERKRVVFEATANARWMYRLLAQDPTVEPVAVTPHKVRIIAETIAKTDKIDARVLAFLSQKDALPRAWLPDPDVEELRELTRYRASLVRLRTMAKNRVNGALVRQGLLRPYGDIFGPQGRRWLAEATLPAPMRLQVDHWLELIEEYGDKLRRVESRLYDELGKSRRWAEDIGLLLTMPGVGKLTAVTILAELGDYRRFKGRASVACYAGLVVRSKRSDESVHYGRLTKRGPTALRTILVEVSIQAARRSPRYARLYQKLRAQNRPNAGKAAVARQMLEDAWTLLMKREPFRHTAQDREAMETLTRVG